MSLDEKFCICKGYLNFVLSSETFLLEIHGYFQDEHVEQFEYSYDLYAESLSYLFNSFDGIEYEQSRWEQVEICLLYLIMVLGILFNFLILLVVFTGQK